MRRKNGHAGEYLTGKVKRIERSNGGTKTRQKWGTPRASDGMKGVRTPQGAARERVRRKQGVDLPTAAGGTLDPVFCEWYMGFEDGWTDVESKH